MREYFHELPDWALFTWDQGKLAEPLAALRYRQGILWGRMEALGFPMRQEAVLRTITQDVLKSSEIEGDWLDMAQVRSSLAQRLGIDIGALKPTDRLNIREGDGARIAPVRCRWCRGRLGGRKSTSRPPRRSGFLARCESS